jgi:hypothetical protein
LPKGRLYSSEIVKYLIPELQFTKKMENQSGKSEKRWNITLG